MFKSEEINSEIDELSNFLFKYDTSNNENFSKYQKLMIVKKLSN